MSRATATRLHHQGALTDPGGHPVITEQAGPHQPIYVVHPRSEAEDIVSTLLTAGYVVLTRDEAARLGVHR